MRHPFFQDVDWKALEQKEIHPPWKPSLSGETDTSYFNNKYTCAEVYDEETGSEKTVFQNFPKFTFMKNR